MTTVVPGTRLGPYEIVALLGSGGMGEVYRARDTRLGREVAVKVLPDEFAKDPDRLRRFEGEARSASSLSDPHIVAVFDIGSDKGVSYFATELVEGTDLRALLEGEPLPVRKALDLGEQIASGLAAAHAKGIVHRDLKPENVLVAKSGLAKIADFGLAKLSETSGGSVSQLPTSDGRQTTAGVVMGTVAYMSPEQTRGAALDFRSDQFAFGSMLYEMLGGRPAFRRGSQAETLSAILREEPAPLSPSVPPPLRWIVERCLAKDPESRYASTADLRRDLQSLREHFSEAVSVSPDRPVTGSQRRFRAGAAAAAFAIGLALGAVGLRFVTGRSVPASAPSFRRLTFQRGNILHGRFGPDGRTIFYSAAWEDKPADVFVTHVDSTESRPLGLVNADLAAVSAESGLLVLRKSRDLKTAAGLGTLARVSLEGGAARDVAEEAHDGDWLPGGVVVVRKHIGFGHDALEFPPGTRRLDGLSQTPRVSLDGNRIAAPRGSDYSVAVLDAAGKTLWTSGAGTATDIESLAWHPNGEVWYSRSAGPEPGIFALAEGKPPRPVLRATSWVLHDIARDGRLLLERGILRRSLRVRLEGEARERELSWLDGSALVGMSSDRSTLLFSEINEAGARVGGVYARRTDGSPAVRLADGNAIALSDDGRWSLVLTAAAPPRYSLVPTGAGETRPLDFGGDSVQSAAFLPAPDPRFVALVGPTPDRAHLEIVSTAGRRRIMRSPEFMPGPYWVYSNLVVSPDGAAVAWQGREDEVTLCTLEGAPCRILKVKNGSNPVQWSGDGRFLYLSDAGHIPVPVTRYEITTGAEVPWLTLGPEDPTAFISIGRILLSRDGRSYAYNAQEVRDSGLFVVEGLR